MNWTHSNLNGTVSLDGQIVAFTSGSGWRAALTHVSGDNPIRAVRTAIYRLPNDATAEDIRREAITEMGELLR